MPTDECLTIGCFIGQLATDWIELNWIELNWLTHIRWMCCRRWANKRRIWSRSWKVTFWNEIWIGVNPPRRSRPLSIGSNRSYSERNSEIKSVVCRWATIGSSAPGNSGGKLPSSSPLSSISSFSHTRTSLNPSPRISHTHELALDLALICCCCLCFVFCVCVCICSFIQYGGQFESSLPRLLGRIAPNSSDWNNPDRHVLLDDADCDSETRCHTKPTQMEERRPQDCGLRFALLGRNQISPDKQQQLVLLLGIAETLCDGFAGGLLCDLLCRLDSGQCRLSLLLRCPHVPNCSSLRLFAIRRESPREKRDYHFLLGSFFWILWYQWR